MTGPEDGNDWSALAETWRSAPQPGIDLAAWQRRVEGKRRWMIAAVSIELALTLVASALVVARALDPSRAHGRGWAWIVLACIWLLQALMLYVRRGQWRTPTLAVHDLLEVTARRARTGIRLVWLNVAAFIVMALVAIPFAQGRWNDRRLSERSLPAAVAGGVSLVGSALFAAWYLRRQRRTLRTVGELLRDLQGQAGG